MAESRIAGPPRVVAEAKAEAYREILEFIGLHHPDVLHQALLETMGVEVISQERESS